MTKKQIATAAVEALKAEYPDAKCSLTYTTPLQLLIATRLYIKSCGLFKTKSKDIVEMSKKILSDFGGEVPDTIEKLTTLPGVGRKTANLICGDVFGKPAVVVDTHCMRITTRLGLHKLTDQKKIEMELKKLLPPEESNNFCHRLVLHGRAVCTARSPKCEGCCMKGFCRTGVNTIIK